MSSSAFREYRTRFTVQATPLFVQGIQSMYADAQTLSKGVHVIKQFQLLLRNVPKFPEGIINGEHARMTTSRPRLEELYYLAIQTYINMLLAHESIRVTRDIIREKISFKGYIHRVYTEAAREIYSEPMFMHHSKPDYDHLTKIVRRHIRRELKNSVDVEDVLNWYDSSKSESESDREELEREDSSSSSDDDFQLPEPEPVSLEERVVNFGPAPEPVPVPVPVQAPEPVPVQAPEPVPVPVQPPSLFDE